MKSKYEIKEESTFENGAMRISMSNSSITNCPGFLVKILAFFSYHVFAVAKVDTGVVALIIFRLRHNAIFNWQLFPCVFILFRLNLFHKCWCRPTLHSRIRTQWLSVSRSRVQTKFIAHRPYGLNDIFGKG